MKKRKTSIKIINNTERWGEYKFYSGELWPFNVFVVLKIIFSEHQLIKIRMTCVHKASIKKKNDDSYKWRLYRVIRWTLLYDGGRNDIFDSGRCKFISCYSQLFGCDRAKLGPLGKEHLHHLMFYHWIITSLTCRPHRPSCNRLGH